MADTKEITLYNRSKAERVIYDANGATHSFLPGQAKKVTVATAAAKRFGEFCEQGDDLTTQVPNGVVVDDQTAAAGAPDPEAAYAPRKETVDVAALEAAERAKQDAANAGSGDGKQRVNAGGAPTGGQKVGGAKTGEGSGGDAPDFDKMTVDQLKEYAETNKIALEADDKKADIVKKVKAHKPAE